MIVSLHARGQLLSRLPSYVAVTIIRELEHSRAPEGSEARIVRRTSYMTDGQSNGDVVVAIIVDGEVRTVYFRRSTQTFTPEAFRVERIVDSTKETA